jgi:hypothetical protein
MVLTGSFIIRQSKTILSAGLAFKFFPRAHSLLKTRRETRTLRFIGICRCVGIRQIDGARSNFYLTEKRLTDLSTNLTPQAYKGVR